MLNISNQEIKEMVKNSSRAMLAVNPKLLVRVCDFIFDVKSLRKEVKVTQENLIRNRQAILEIDK
jgi:hypothetical protein